jgi:hypothetical protein
MARLARFAIFEDGFTAMLHTGFPYDPKLPELALAANTSEMARVFAQHIWPSARGRFQAEDCRISRIRYHRQSRCHLQYSLTLRDRSTGMSSRQWLTGALFADSEQVSRLLRKETSGVSCTVPDVVPMAFIPEMRMLVHVFPHDHRLPQACLVVTGRDPGLDAAVLRAFGGGAWTIESWHAEPVRYRQGVSLVVRYDVTARERRTNVTEGRTFYLKAYPDLSHPRLLYQQLEWLSLYTAQAPLGLRIDAPVALLPHLQAVLLPATPGRPLDEVLSGPDEWEVISAVCETARALAKFNQSDAPTDRRYCAADYVAALEGCVALLDCACPDLAPDLRAIVAAVEDETEDTDPHPTHRDLKPEHVLIDEETVGLVDFESYAGADPVHDAAMMLARFTALGFHTVDARRMRAAAAAFADEYFSSVPADWRERLRALYAGALVEVAAGIFHRQEYGWPQRATALVKEAVAALDGGALPGEGSTV